MLNIVKLWGHQLPGITKCLSANRWVDESAFEVKGTSNARSGIPHHARLNHLQQVTKQRFVVILPTLHKITDGLYHIF